MPRLASELFEMSDEEFLVANSQVDPDSLLGSSETPATVADDGADPVAANQGDDDGQEVPAGTGVDGDGGAADDAADGAQPGAGDPDGADEDQGVDVPDDEFDPKVPADAKPADKPAAGDAKPAAVAPGTVPTPGTVTNPDGSATPPKGGDPASEVKPGETPASPLTEAQLRDFYDKVMKPFKANGKDIQARTPEEALRLMQMGAGYGKKLNDMQPHLKALRILEKHGLLDENKLSFLVDVNAKNPDAIKQLLRDAKIDPLDLNMEEGSDYKAPNHSVPDAEVAFKEVLADVRAVKGGQETIRHVNESWDEPSKARLWKQPEILRVIQSQRETGVYDQIVAEVERQKLFGTIKPNTPFIDAYKTAGDSLVRAAGIDPTTGKPTQVQQVKVDPAPVQPAAPVALGTKTAKPKAPVSNDAKARAAASSTNKAAKVVAPVDMLDMSDDDFMKQFGPKF
jgi:hypothetical protein